MSATKQKDAVLEKNLKAADMWARFCRVRGGRAPRNAT
jgi:hypothetical protein